MRRFHPISAYTEHRPSTSWSGRLTSGAMHELRREVGFAGSGEGLTDRVIDRLISSRAEAELLPVEGVLMMEDGIGRRMRMRMRRSMLRMS